jgi:sn-glycerol 3-phosphate transport system ATP-binding protein
MPSIAVRDLHKRWDAVAALRGVSFDARESELLVLLGPSGCGKSTTLRIIAGLDDATEGRVLFGTRDVTELLPSQRGISMVFQSYALFPHLSVRENVVFGLRVRRTPEAEREKRLQRAADILAISHLLDRKPAQLSGGQKQRVALARAIVAEAPICLMDEPLSNLDAQLRHEMRTEIRGLQQRLGMTMIYVTHDQTEAMTMADQVILLREGEVEQQGSPQDLYFRPRTRFVAQFIGTPPMNIVDVDRAGLAEALRAQPGGEALARAGSGLVVGVRPEDIRLADRGVPARVRSAEFLGAESIVLCELGGQPVSARIPGVVTVASGANVCLAWDAAAQHFFGPDGLRRDVPGAEAAA